MTLIIGYIYKDSAHIIADSAETYERSGTESSDPPKEIKTLWTSSFGEPLHVDANGVVFENAQKIYSIDGRILLAFSGAVWEGEKMVEDFRISCRVNDGKEPLKEIIPLFFKTRDHPENEFIVAFYENGSPYIYANNGHGSEGFASNETQAKFVGGGVNFGNIIQALEVAWPLAHQSNFSEDECLIYILSTFQKATMDLRAMSAGIGGHFNGTYINSSGIAWAKDTLHFLYSIKDFETGDLFQIFRYNRNNIGFLVSNKREANTWIRLVTRYFATKFDSPPNDELKTTIDNLIQKMKVEYCVMMSYDVGIIAIVNMKKQTDKILFNDDNSIEFEGSLSEYMFAYKHLPGDGQKIYQIYHNFDMPQLT